jgi:hypothetical protein
VSLIGAFLDLDLMVFHFHVKLGHKQSRHDDGTNKVGTMIQFSRGGGGCKTKRHFFLKVFSTTLFLLVKFFSNYHYN